MEDFNRPEVKNSMVEIFVNFFSFLLLGIIATAVGFLYFQVINKYFPDVLSGTYSNSVKGGFSASIINYSIAALIVGFPIYLWTVWFWFRGFSSSISGAEKVESRLSKWLTYIVLLIASGMIIGDLITVIYNFLQGEYGARFLLKALTILIIAGLVFGFYFLERKKIQYKKAVPSRFFWFFGVFSGVLVISAIILGFVVGGTPHETRLKKFDLQRTADLQEISSCIGSFSYDNERLPKSLDELKNNARYNCAFRISDPETNKDYEYRTVSKTEFELCAEFTSSNLDEFQNIDYYGKWEKHDKGRMCEKQTVTFGKQAVPSVK